MRKFVYLLIALIFLISITPVQPASAATKLNKSKITIKVDETYHLQLSGADKGVKWSSNDKKIAKVSSAGKVKGLDAGEATITATYNGKKYTCKVTVIEEELTMADITKHLLDKKLIVGEETKMDASLIGAISGVKYSDSNFEIYEFDVNSNAYKSLVKTNMIVLDGLNLEFPASGINGKFVIYCEEADNYADIVKEFKKIK